MSLKRKLSLYTFFAFVLIITLYTFLTVLIINKILETEANKEYNRILNLYTFGREFSLAKDEFAQDSLKAFEELSLFIKRVNNFEIVFIYDIKALKKTFTNVEEFLKGKEIFENYTLQGDVLNNKEIIDVILKTDTYRVYGGLLNPTFIYVYPINLNGNTIGKVAFIERFSLNLRLILGTYIFLIVFTLLSTYLPIKLLGHIVRELKFLKDFAISFSNKDFSKIDALRENIRNTKEHNELYQLKVSLLKMAETLEQHIRHLEVELKSYENLAFIDPLTGLYNRRMFLELAEKKLNEAKRYKESLSLIMLDIDHFKRINDTYGHGVGDMALKSLTEILRKNLRASDIVARWGGEEFVIILPKTTLEQAYNVAEKIRKLVEISAIDLPNGEKLKFTVSLGVSFFSGEEDLEELIRQADIALYEAKSKGRNRTEVYRRGLSL